MVVKNKQLTERAIYVYLPTVGMANGWKQRASKARVPISKFVIEHVENSLKQEADRKISFTSRVELLDLLQEKDEEIASLKNENRLLKMLADNLDRELKRYRAQPFLDEGRRKKFAGKRAYDKELIEVLRKNESIDNDHILKELGIKPKDTELVKAVNKQLELLQAYGLVEPTRRGWRWVQ